MSSGIYKIENIVNNKVYVGSSNNIKRRWQKHRALLRHNKHPNRHLQSAWNKYGESSFRFFIIELCDNTSLLDREQYFIDTIKPEYNQTLVAGKIEMTADRKKKLSYSVILAYKEGRFKKATKHIYQYDLRGNYIGEYNSITDASTSLNIPSSNISSAVNNKCNIAGGFVWRFYKTNKLDVWFNRMGRAISKEPYRKKDRKIVIYKDGRIFKLFSTAEAIKFLGCSKHQLYKALTLGRLINKTIKVMYE